MDPDIEADPEIGTEETEILAFIAKQRFVGWTGMKKEFVGVRKWNYSTFVGHWNNIKDKYVEKVKNEKTGLPWYKICDQAKKLGEKAVLSTQIASGKLNNVEISIEKLEKAAELIAQNSWDLWQTAIEKSSEGIKTAEEKLAKGELNDQEIVSGKPEEMIYSAIVDATNQMKSDLEEEKKKQGILGKIKHIKKSQDKPDPRGLADFNKTMYSVFFARKTEEEKRKAELMKIFEKVKIQIVSSPGETVPLLTETDVLKIIEVVVPKIMDENKGKPREKPFQLVISFPT